LENGGSKDDEVPRGMWEIVETSAREIWVGKTERRRSKERSQEEERGKGIEEETEKRKDNRGKESGRGMRDMR